MSRCVRVVFNENLLEVITGLAFSRRHAARPLLIRYRGGVQASVAPEVDQVQHGQPSRTDDSADQRCDNIAGACQETCTSSTSTKDTERH